jgi:GT2 family glycosyltransferase
MELSTIIVNWNSREYLRNCLNSIGPRYWTAPNETVVVDSGSFDGCDAMLAEEFPGVRFIQLPENVGFGRANNEAFRASKGKYVLFLNPDIEAEESAIEILLDGLRSAPDAGCVGCILLNGDRSLQTSCVQALPTILNQFVDAELLRRAAPWLPIWGTEALYAGGGEPRKVEVVSGACVVLRREAFQRAGMFSEDYFMYGEDVDLSHKLLALGYSNYLIPEARMVHFGGGSSAGAKGHFAAVMMREAIWSFFKRNRGSGYAGGYRLAMIASALLRTVILAAAVPALAAKGRLETWRNAWGKWISVLEWAILRKRSLARLQ